MLGHAEIWFYEYLAGIRVDLSKAPPEQIVIRPAIVGDVTWAKASYLSALGTIACHWRRQDKTLKLKVTIPPGNSALIYIPTNDPAQMREAGKPIDQHTDLSIVERQVGAVACRACSGRFEFETPIG